MSIIAFLMIFWFIIRTVKYFFISEELYPGIVRHLWYMYYFAMLFIPLLAVFVAMSIGKTENSHLPKKALLLYIPTLFLFLMVITNDLHELVFTFPADTAVRTDNNYSYGIGYYIVTAWMFFCALTMLFVMNQKRRVAGSKKLIFIPCIPIVALLLYLIFYFSGVSWLRAILGDVTAVICLMYAATLELCVQCGFIQANTHYMELFYASTAGAQITDKDYHVILSSVAAKNVDTETLAKTKNEPVMLKGGLRLSGAPIKKGHVVWTEDMSPLLKVLEELQEAKENLEDSNKILEEEHALKKREAHIMEQDRLYNIIQHDTAHQIYLMDTMIKQAETADGDEKRKLLQKMLVIGAYLKRRSNLVFLADKSSMLDANELVLTIGESLDNLEVCGIFCGFRTELTEPVLAYQIIAMYDFFENVVERALDRICSIIVYAGKRDGSLFLNINTDSTADFSDFVSDNTTRTELRR
ncbi:MAG: histidine kinase N-terminal 7TM domain-containing protein [Clostridia bacterium]